MGCFVRKRCKKRRTGSRTDSCTMALVFSTKEESYENLWVQEDHWNPATCRLLTAVLVSLGVIVPKGILTYIDW